MAIARTVFVLGYRQYSDQLQDLAGVLRGAAYVVSPVAVQDERRLIDWEDTASTFDAVVLVGLDGNESILQRLGDYKGPVVLVTERSSYAQAENGMQGISFGFLVDINADISQSVLQILQQHFST